LNLDLSKIKIASQSLTELGLSKIVAIIKNFMIKCKNFSSTKKGVSCVIDVESI
jgi:hypothetical protein